MSSLAKQLWDGNFSPELKSNIDKAQDHLKQKQEEKNAGRSNRELRPEGTE